MSDYLYVLTLALLPAFGNFGRHCRGSRSGNTADASRALHVAAGIIVAVVAVELLPEALAGAAPWLVVLGFCAGGAFSHRCRPGTGPVPIRAALTA